MIAADDDEALDMLADALEAELQEIRELIAARGHGRRRRRRAGRAPDFMSREGAERRIEQKRARAYL